MLVDGDVVLPESTSIIEYLDGRGDAPPLAGALQARLWDRLLDGHVMTPMQKIVADALRPEGAHDPYGVDEARATLDAAYALLEDRVTGGWLAGPAFSLADCAAAPSLFYAYVVHPWDGFPRLRAYLERLTAHPPVARVIDEARPYRELFPLGWPEHVR